MTFSFENMLRLVLLFAFVFVGPVLSAAAQDGPMVWQFREISDEASPDVKMATLAFGVPETDNVQISGDCKQADAGEDALVSLIFGTDVGSKQEDDWVDLDITAGSFRETVKGTVFGTKQEEGVTGALVKLGFDDALWTAMQENEAMTYGVRGQVESGLRLKGGHSTIRRFISTCKSYAPPSARTATRPSSGSVAILAAGPRTQQKPKAEASKSASPGPSDVSEKDAYEAAKDLGTLEAWEAFLTRFPTGFRADLARAYVRKIGASPVAAVTPDAADRDVDSKTAAVPEELLSTVEVGPGTSAWITTRYSMDEGNASAEAAAVNADGVELLFFCNSEKRLSGILREKTRGVYPDFDNRIGQGLAERRRRGQDKQNAFVRMSFSNDNIYSVSAAVQELTGEVSLGYLAEGGGFDPSGDLVSDLMGSRTVKISAPPFGATFQLSKSRRALCQMMNTCGASSSSCR
jgi:hypothetical protein